MIPYRKRLVLQRFIDVVSLKTTYRKQLDVKQRIKNAMVKKPIKKGIITSGYGDRINPFPPYATSFHGGIDIAVKGNPDNVPVYCTHAGQVAYINHDISQGKNAGGGFGRVVYLKMPDGYYTIYAHLSLVSYDLKNGDDLKAGDFIGIMGSTGHSTGKHLHYQIRSTMGSGGESRCPQDVIDLYA